MRLQAMSRAMLHAQLRAVASVLDLHRDVLDSRPDVQVRDRSLPPATALMARGWAPFLLDLDDASVDALEACGVDGDWTAAPPSLRAFVESVACATALPTLLAPSAGEAPRCGERAHKQQQVDAFAHLVASVAGAATRIVDVGSGHGHLTRALAAAMSAPVVGLERDRDFAARARELAARAGAANVAFEVVDVVRDGLAVRPADCVVGLHACGELGDVVARAAAGSPSSVSVVFVGCCLQKQQSTVRRPLSIDTTLVLPKPLLGLSNLTPGDVGVEARRVDNLVGRRHRIALRLLLAQAGVFVRPRAELEGLNRRATHAALHELVAVAFNVRGLAPPTAKAINDAGDDAATLHARFRRLALPRSLLARAIEIFVVLDRGALLQAHGFDVSAGVLFGVRVSPRNIALVASR